MPNSASWFTVASIAAAAYAARTGTPGGHPLLVGSILWAIAATITVAIVPKGDYAKALRALGWRKPASQKPADVTRERTGPGRRSPRGHEIRNAVIGWSLAGGGLADDTGHRADHGATSAPGRGGCAGRAADDSGRGRHGGAGDAGRDMR